MVENNVIQAHLIAGTSIKDKVNHLVQEANTNGGKDNISVVMAEFL